MTWWRTLNHARPALFSSTREESIVRAMFDKSE